ncbi:MAG: MBL fold metallo-hydrolase [Sphingomicrobium sp.]
MVALSGFELRPRHGVCTKRNIMFWRTHIHAMKLGDNLYVLKVYGTDLINANTVALIGDEGVLLVDPGAPEMLDKERAALPRSRDSRLRFVIDSHAHPDHACANGEAFHQGAIIVGHDNVRKFFERSA